MPLIADSSVPESQTASGFALSVLRGNVIVQSPVNTAILNDCHDRYSSATELSAVPRDSISLFYVANCSIEFRSNLLA